jgi:non-lysosomal glucosylceramidase
MKGPKQPNPHMNSPELNRRLFLKKTGAGTLALMAMGLGKGFPVMAGPFEVSDFEKLVPVDKKLSAAWLRSLTERSEADWLSDTDLKYVGMPVGGLCCGQVYLSGDGRLWHWDIFNAGGRADTRGGHYAKPMSSDDGIDIGFTLRARSEGRETTHSLDHQGFSKIRFRGAYPMGFVDYADDHCPVNVSLEAFSPFAPLETDDSSLPLTVMRYTVRNSSKHSVEVSLAGHLANPILKDSKNYGAGAFVNTVGRRKGATYVQYTVEKHAQGAVLEDRSDVVYEDFESDTYDNWTVEGTAFGSGPVIVATMPRYQSGIGAKGERLVNSHNTRNGENAGAADALTGVMTSKPFTIERRYIHALVGGGRDAEKTSLQLLIDGKVIAKVAGQNKNAMQRESFDVTEYEGQTARLRIVDQSTGGWGNIGVDHITFSDRSNHKPQPLNQRSDFGDMTLAVLDHGEAVFAAAELPAGATDQRFQAGAEISRSGSNQGLVGVVGKTVSLQPGEEATVSFTVAWRFPNARAPVGTGHYYAECFPTSLAAVDELTNRYEELYARTRLWHETWYDSTLPHWLLDRTFVNTSTLASRTCMRMEGGRFYGMEGVNCCGGTCIHVWHYAQSVGRVFPELERITREGVDYGVAFHSAGIVGYRGEQITHEAHDGQCGTILRVYREHTMSPDDAFLGRIWPRVKESIQFLIAEDGDGNGVLEGKQFNTLDSAWYGPSSWISSLYIAALRAGSTMALEMGDSRFASECNTLADRGGKWLTENLFDGEYFIQQRDPDHPEAIGSGIGCHIDQVLGQGWAHQVGLGRILPKKETESALKALWRYNFTPDVGVYRNQYKPGRWYAMPGEAGLLMTTFPKGGMQEAGGGISGKGFAGYFNECMTGFEYQAAGHMIAEGMVEEGLAITRSIHERYSPSRRNPYNEIECGDHYSRAMASHGVFVSVCGFEYHGPKGVISFAPRLSPEDFRAPFIAAEGWGTFAQQRKSRMQTQTLQLNHGQLNLQQLGFVLAAGAQATSVQVTLDGAVLAADHRMADERVVIELGDATTIQTGQLLEVQIQV